MFNTLTQTSFDSSQSNSQFANMRKEVLAGVKAEEVQLNQHELPTTSEEKTAAVVLCEDSPSKEAQMEHVPIDGKQSVSNTPPDLQTGETLVQKEKVLPMPSLDGFEKSSLQSTNCNDLAQDQVKDDIDKVSIPKEDILEDIDSQESRSDIPMVSANRNDQELLKSPDIIFSSQTQDNNKIGETPSSSISDRSILQTVGSTTLQTNIVTASGDADEGTIPKNPTNLFDILQAASKSDNKSPATKKRRSMKKSMYSKTRRKSQTKKNIAQEEVATEPLTFLENKQISLGPSVSCEVTISPIDVKLKAVEEAKAAKEKSGDVALDQGVNTSSNTVAEPMNTISNTVAEPINVLKESSNTVLSETDIFKPVTNESTPIVLKAGMKRRRHSIGGVKNSNVDIAKKRKSESDSVAPETSHPDDLKMEKDIFDFSEEEALKAQFSTPKRATSLWKSKSPSNQRLVKNLSDEQTDILHKNDDENEVNGNLNSSHDDSLPLSSLKKEHSSMNAAPNLQNSLINKGQEKASKVEESVSKTNPANVSDLVATKKDDLDSSLPIERKPVEVVAASTPESEVPAKSESKSLGWMSTISAKLTTLTSVSTSSANSSPKVVSPLNLSTKVLVSPAASPRTGILKKSKKADSATSTPNKSRRVSFNLPSHDTSLNDSGEILAQPLDQDDTHKPQIFHKKKSKPLKSQPAIFPDLISCTAPIEKIIPSLTFSRGLGHIVRAQNILTVGDLSALSENQIENLPIRSPKVATVKNVLNQFRRTSPPRMPAVATPYPRKMSSLAQRETGTPTRSKKSSHEKPKLLFSDEKTKPSVTEEESKASHGKPILFSLEEKTIAGKENVKTATEKRVLPSEEEKMEPVCNGDPVEDSMEIIASPSLEETAQPVTQGDADTSGKEDHAQEIRETSTASPNQDVSDAVTPYVKEVVRSIPNQEVPNEMAPSNLEEDKANDQKTAEKETKSDKAEPLSEVESYCDVGTSSSLFTAPDDIDEPAGNIHISKPSNLVSVPSDNNDTNCQDHASSSISKDNVCSSIDKDNVESSNKTDIVPIKTMSITESFSNLLDSTSSAVSNLTTAEIFELIEQTDKVKAALLEELKQRFIEK